MTGHSSTHIRADAGRARRPHPAGGFGTLTRMLIWTATLLILGASSQVDAQKRGTVNLYNGPADVENGATSFKHHCANCHGPDGRGGHAPDLSLLADLTTANGEALFRTIRYGIAGTEMRGTRFPDKRVWQLVSYLQTMSTGVQREAVPGDSRKGETLFRRLGCLNCHWINGGGRRLGPDLSGIGDRRSLNSLRTSLLEPDAEIDRAYWQLNLVANDGAVVRGFALHEDSFSIRLIDFDERLRRFEKQDLSEMQVLKSSFMASYENQLVGEDLDDLVSYLYTLRR